MHAAIIFLIVAVAAVQVHSHGAMWDPPNRSSMWRFGFDNPANYDDNQNYCGGMGIQWGTNQGKCGICGDAYNTPTPRPNEHGGKYGNGIIVAKYKSGQTIDVNIHLSASHKGDFTFGICNLDNQRETEDCFQPLKFENGADKWEDIPAPQDYHLKLRLPQGLKCQQCSLRWHYRTGNTYGDCGDGTQAVGCGPQETFRNCADISIS